VLQAKAWTPSVHRHDGARTGYESITWATGTTGLHDHRFQSRVPVASVVAIRIDLDHAT
jgi:hypothetical protein